MSIPIKISPKHLDALNTDKRSVETFLTLLQMLPIGGEYKSLSYKIIKVEDNRFEIITLRESILRTWSDPREQLFEAEDQ